MAGNLELDTLRQDVASGAIDTVLVCLADMQGRLIGKRVTGHFFHRPGRKDARLQSPAPRLRLRRKPADLVLPIDL